MSIRSEIISTGTTWKRLLALGFSVLSLAILIPAVPASAEADGQAAPALEAIKADAPAPAAAAAAPSDEAAFSGLSSGCGNGEPGALVWTPGEGTTSFAAVLTGRAGTFACVELTNPQYAQKAVEDPIEGVPAWLISEGPHHMVTTWSTGFLPFVYNILAPREGEMGPLVTRTLKQPATRSDVPGDWAPGKTVEAGFFQLYADDPVFTRVSEEGAEEVIYVWPDPRVDRSPVWVERRIRRGESYFADLSVTVFNFGDKVFEFSPNLEIHAWDKPGQKSSFFSPPPDLLESLCLAGGSLTRKAGGDLVEDGLENVKGEASWIGVGGRYFLLAAIQKDMEKAGCQLFGLGSGVVSSRMYKPISRLEPWGGGCVPSWHQDSKQPRCADWARELEISESDLNDPKAVERVLKDKPSVGDARAVLDHVQGKSREAIDFTLFMGPKELSHLKAPDAGLEDSIDFWVVGFISKPMLQFLRWFHSMVPSWTLAIIMLTILVKLLLLPLTQKSFAQMQRMGNLKPQMDELRKKYGNDKARMNQETMNLYKREKVNPLGGCLPMLFQMPIWIALYRTIQSCVDLFQAPMGLWIQDLSAPDPYFVLPLALGGLMFLQQKLTPTTMDSSQAKMMLYVMPVMFTVFMLFLPSGLNLYILVNTILSLGQQYYLKRKYAVPAAA